MKKLIVAAVLLACVVPGQAQNWTTVTSTNVTDLNQQKLAAGQLCFLGTDQTDTPVSFSVGGGGQVLKRPFCAAVAGGAVASSFTVPNPALTTPAGIYYRVTVKDTSTGQEVLRYTQVTFNGATFNFDNYAPVNLGSFAPPTGNAVSGNLTVNGNLSVTGTIGNPTFTGNLTLPATGAATSSVNFGSPLETRSGSYWNGSAPASDSWTAQSFLAAGTNPNSFLVFNHSGSPGSFFQVNSQVQIPATTAATSASNVNSPMFSLLGNYWTGTASTGDTWGIQDVLGTGANPTATLSLSHLGGSTGATTVDVSSAGTLKTGAINAGSNTVAGSIFQVPGAANLQIDTNRFGALGLRVQAIGTNATQALTVMPSGTATESTFRLHNTSDPLNTGALQLDLTGTSATLSGTAFGTGSAPTMLGLTGMGLQLGGRGHGALADRGRAWLRPATERREILPARSNPASSRWMDRLQEIRRSRPRRRLQER